MSENSFHTPLMYQNRTFSYYLSQIEAQRWLLQEVRKGLPEHLAQHACHCLVSNNTVLIYTDSAIWASQLRFYSQTLLTTIAPLMQEAVQKIHIKVMTQNTGVSFSTVGKANLPTPATIDMMQKQSFSVSDTALQEALQRLNATLKRLADES